MRKNPAKRLGSSERDAEDVKKQAFFRVNISTLFISLNITCVSFPDNSDVVALKKMVKVKEVDLYSAFIVVPHTQGAQVRITQCYLQITPYLPLPRKHSPDGASPD